MLYIHVQLSCLSSSVDRALTLRSSQSPNICIYMCKHNIITSCLCSSLGRPLVSKKSWVQIPPEAAHFPLKMESELSQVLMCLPFSLTTFLISSNIHIIIIIYMCIFVTGSSLKPRISIRRQPFYNDHCALSRGWLSCTSIVLIHAHTHTHTHTHTYIYNIYTETLTHSIVGIISLTISKNHLTVTVIIVT